MLVLLTNINRFMLVIITYILHDITVNLIVKLHNTLLKVIRWILVAFLLNRGPLTETVMNLEPSSLPAPVPKVGIDITRQSSPTHSFNKNIENPTPKLSKARPHGNALLVSLQEEDRLRIHSRRASREKR